MHQFFCGIDTSLTGTGLIIINQNYKICEEVLISTKPSKCMEQRIIDIIEKIESVLKDYSIISCFMEGVSPNSKGSAVHNLAGLHMATRIFLYNQKIEFMLIPPTSLKKFVFKGNAKKELMLKECYKQYGEDFYDNNLCDAYCLARMALEDFKNENNK